MSLFVQMFFSSNVTLDTATLTNFVKTINFSVLSLRAANKSLAAPQNEVDTSLVKSQLIYFQT
jgi:hypothetical protein